MMLVTILIGIVLSGLVGMGLFFKMQDFNITKVQNIVLSTIVGIVCFVIIVITSTITIEAEENKWNHGKCTSCNGEWEYVDSTVHIMRSVEGRKGGITTYFYKCDKCHKTEQFLIFHN